MRLKLVGWLILLPFMVGWYIMGCESDPLPSYHKLSNLSYYIMLSYPKYFSTPQVHLPRPCPTIAPSGLSPVSAPSPCIAHVWGIRTPSLLWLPAISWCTPIWGVSPRLPLAPLPGVTPTLCLLHVSPSSPRSISPPGGVPHLRESFLQSTSASFQD